MTARRHRRSQLRRSLRLERCEPRCVLAADLGAAWGHNVAWPEDVDADSWVSPRDAVLVINQLNQAAHGEGEVGSGSPYFTDVTGDGQLSPADALAVINWLNGEAEPPPVAEGEPLPASCGPADLASAVITDCEVRQLLARAAGASASENAIVAIVDRGGRILGVRLEQGVLDAIPDTLTRSFAIDGAVAKARTAAFFSNDQAPLTSRTVRFISQSTITQREVESNPTVADPLTDDPFDPTDPASLTFGPGFVAPIGLGGHFPPDIAHTPVVDLFGIERQSRDSLIHPGLDAIKGTADDVPLASRFNVALEPGDVELPAPEAYGVQSGQVPFAQSRGLATLPGGVPLYKNGHVVGGIGVFFPGDDGYATFEQGFVPGIGQTTEQRLNAAKVLEAEWIAFAAAGGVRLCASPVPAAVGDLGGVPPVPGYGLPFGRIDLVGITLEIYGPNATTQNPRPGLRTLLNVGAAVGMGDATSGSNQPVSAGGDSMPGTLDDLFTLSGETVPDGWLIQPRDAADLSITAADVEAIVQRAIDEANLTRAAIRLDLNPCTTTPAGYPTPGPRTKMVMAVTDKDGDVLGIYRMSDSTIFSIDVAVAKARNLAYYAGGPVAADQIDDDLLVERGAYTAAELAARGIRTDGTVGTPTLSRDAAGTIPVPAGAPFAPTSRTFRFLVEPRYPSGVDGTVPPIFSILNDPGINPRTAENEGAPMPASAFESVMGYDSFHVGTNFRDPGSIANQNGIVFFPGSSPLYVGGNLVGGFGVSGDGVDQDDVVTSAGLGAFAPPAEIRADQTFYRGVRLPFLKFNRNPRA